LTGVSFTEKLARSAGRHPWRTVAIWLAVFLASFVAVIGLLGSALTSTRHLPGTDSQRGTNLLDQRLPNPKEADEQIVVHSSGATLDDPAFRGEILRLRREIDATGVATAKDPYTSPKESLASADRHAATLPVDVLTTDESQAETDVGKVIKLVQAANGQGRFDVNIVGKFTTERDLGTLSQDDLRHGEVFFGAPVALAVLVLVFGALVGALVPVLMSVLAIVIALGLTAVIGQALPINLFIVNMISGMGLALGIDYSLFVVSRYREERARGRHVLDAIAATGATSSRAVFFSGIVFVLALFGMLLVPNTVLRSLAFGAILVGLVSVAAALTLLPAVLALLGDRVNRLHVPVIGRRLAEGGVGEGRFWSAIVRAVMRRPVVSLVLAGGLLLAAAAPVLDIKYGDSGITDFPTSSVSRQGIDALVANFPRAGSEPAKIVVDGNVGSPEVEAATKRLETRLRTDADFGGSLEVEAHPAQRIALIAAPVAGDPSEPRAKDAVQRLRDEYIPNAFSGVDAKVYVTGTTAESIDSGSVTKTWLPIVIALVLGLSLVLLTVAFRSVVLPVKAILLNLLSVGAAYGLMVLVFVKGYAVGFFGFHHVHAIESWVPLFLFSVLFGLSMDYHVFLLSRIRERFVQTDDNSVAVAYGVGSTARLITGAALIMVAVFTGFAIGDLAMFQQMGFGLAVALIIDATIVRSVLVPAGMQLLGSRNWYLPGWLAWIPDAHLEGGAEHTPDVGPAAPGPATTS
jgi:putative drug exporter of the RND superfamily